MKSEKNEALKKSKRPASSIVLYVASIVVALIGIAFLVTNIIIFQKSVAQYVGQGYAAADVTSQMLINQLLPGIYQPIAVYGGIALILFAAGKINYKISTALKMLGDLGVAGTALFADEINEKVEAEVEVAEIETKESDTEKTEA